MRKLFDKLFSKKARVPTRPPAKTYVRHAAPKPFVSQTGQRHPIGSLPRLRPLSLKAKVVIPDLYSFRIAHCPSENSNGVNYSISLDDQSCTCPDFAKMRRRLQPRDHFSRWCKHLVRELHDRELIEFENSWQETIAALGYGGPFKAYQVFLTTAPNVVLTIKPDTEWINVLGRKRRAGEKIIEASGPVAEYGWSLKEKRWSYGQGPAGAGELRKTLLRIESTNTSQLD